MTKNRWLGISQAVPHKISFSPMNVTPGSVWKMRVGTQAYTYVFPVTIENDGLSDNDRARVVVEGLINAYTGGGSFGGGSAGNVLTLSSEILDSRYSLLAIGSSIGEPLDIDVTATDPSAAKVTVAQLQAGRAAQNEIQQIKWPAVPTGGTWNIKFRDRTVTGLAYNISSSALKTAMEGMASIGSGNVDVTGSMSAGFLVEFKGAFAGQDVDAMAAYSTDATGVASYTIKKTVTGGTARQTYTLPKLSGDAAEFWRFQLDGESSHGFSGAADVSAIKTAIEAIVGSGNTAVESQTNGDILITIIGPYVGRALGVLTIKQMVSGEIVTLSASNPTYTDVFTVVRLIFNNLPANVGGSGTFKLSYGGSTTADITFPASIANVNAALATASITTFLCTAVETNNTASYYVELTSQDKYTDSGVVTADVSGLKGCYAIDVRTTQKGFKALNEIQQIAIETNPTGGTFTLQFGANTTAGLAYNASASTVQTALTGLASVGGGNASVSGPAGGPYIVEFISSKAAQDLALIIGNGASLTIAATVSVTTVTRQSPTGRNWWTNAANWSQGHVPTGSEIAVFDAGTVDCCFGIAGVGAFGGMDIYRSFTGRIGLPEKRDNGLPETLPQYLTLTDNTADFPLRIGLGETGDGPAIIRIDTGSQTTQATILSVGTSNSQADFRCALAGELESVSVSSGRVGIAIATGTTATVGLLRLKASANDSSSCSVEYGEGATVTDLESYGATAVGGKPPATIAIDGGTAIIRGSGNVSDVSVRNALLRYHASGDVGKQGVISALGVDGSSQASITSNAHGLASGDRIFLRGVVGIRGLKDGFYTVSVTGANTFSLVGTAPSIPYGASSPSGVSNYYEANTAKWGLADAVRVGQGGVLDFSEVAAARTVVAPVLMQSPDAVVSDPLVTIAKLRTRHNPGPAESDYGIKTVLLRDDYAVTSGAGSSGGSAGGIVASDGLTGSEP